MSVQQGGFQGVDVMNITMQQNSAVVPGVAHVATAHNGPLVSGLVQQPGAISGPSGSKKTGTKAAAPNKWNPQDITSFFDLLKTYSSLDKNACIATIANNMTSKTLDEITEYYNGIIKKIHRMLGSQFSLDMSDHVSVHRAMTTYHEKFEAHASTKKKKRTGLQGGVAKKAAQQKKSKDASESAPAPASATVLSDPSAAQPVAGSKPKTQMSKDSSRGTNDGKKVRFQFIPKTQEIARLMRAGGYIETLTITLSNNKTILSVLEHLSRKWQKAVPNATASSIMLYAPSGTSHAGKCWGGPTVKNKQVMGEIFKTLGGQEPCKLLYSWSTASDHAPSAISGLASRFNRVDTAIELQKAVNTITGIGGPVVSNSDGPSVGAPPGGACVSGDAQPQQRRKFMDMMADDVTEDVPETYNAAPTVNNRSSHQPVVQQQQPPPRIRRELWTTAAPPAPGAAAQRGGVREQLLRRAVAAPLVAGLQQQQQLMAAALAQQQQQSFAMDLAMLQTAQTMPLPAAMMQYIMPQQTAVVATGQVSDAQQAALTAWAQLRQQAMFGQQQQQPQVMPAPANATAVQKPQTQQQQKPQASKSPTKATKKAAKQKTKAPTGEKTKKKGKKNKKGDRQENSQFSWLASDCPSPPSNFHLPDDFAKTRSRLADDKLPAIVEGVDPKKAIDALFSDAVVDGMEGNKTELSLPGGFAFNDFSKFSLLGGLSEISNPLGSLMIGGNDNNTTWLNALDNGQELDSGKAQVGDRPFSALFNK